MRQSTSTFCPVAVGVNLASESKPFLILVKGHNTRWLLMPGGKALTNAPDSPACTAPVTPQGIFAASQSSSRNDTVDVRMVMQVLPHIACP